MSMPDALGPTEPLGPTLDDAATDAQEDRCGPYVLERRIGAGGMGEVFAAHHVETGKRVALKSLKKAHATLRYRFKREFRALADVDHPNLIQLGELFVPETGPSFFTMELLEGEHFVTWVRRGTAVGAPPDISRLEDGIRQLAQGLECLHSNGCVHRDLKPSNVMVTSSGRVVILDFGIIAEQGESDGGVTRDGQVLGTPVYMAPEQAAGARASNAADCYALGVILYECLTGRPPISGAPPHILFEKQFEDTPDPSLMIADVPAHLRELCRRLLHREPGRRPNCAETLERLGESKLSARRRDQTALFVGRERELAALRDAFADVQEHKRAVTVHILGRSGHGKSAMLRRFCTEHHRPEDVVMLRGRCRERESVPYKGVDAVVDALGVYLRHLTGDELLEFRPKYVDALTRVFPVLDEIWIPDRREPLDLDIEEIRSLGWAALREVLSRLANTRPVVVIVDDFQWADLDSVALLRSVSRRPDPPALLLMIAFRAEASGTEVIRALDDQTNSRDVRRVNLGPLPESDARELALTLLRSQLDPGDSPELGLLYARAEAVALRCAGSPFFIGQMVVGGESSGSGADLDQIVVRRLAQLEGSARRVVEVVAVSGGPLPQGLAIELSSAVDEQVDELCSLGLLVRGDSWAGQAEGGRGSEHLGRGCPRPHPRTHARANERE